MSPVLRIQNLETILHTETTAVRAVDGLTLEIPQLKFLDQIHSQDAQHHGRADDAIHVEGLETEHFLNAEPGNGL